MGRGVGASISRPWRDLDVGRKIVAPFVLLTLVAGLLISTVASQQLAAAGADELRVLAVREEDNVNTVVNAFEERQLSDLRLLAATTGVPAALVAGDARGLAPLLLPIAANQLPERVGVIAVTKAGAGVVEVAADPADPARCLCRPAPEVAGFSRLADVLAGRADQYGTRYVGLGGDASAPLVYTVGPVLDDRGYLAGAVIVSEDLAQLLAQLRDDAHAGATLFTADGTALGSTPDLTRALPALSAADRTRALAGDASVVRRVAVQGRQAEVVYMPFAMRHEPLGYLAIELPVDPVGRPETMLAVVVLAVCLGALILTLLVGAVVTRSITRPLSALLATTREVAAGRFDQRAPVESSDEIGQVTVAFNAMVDVLAERTRRLERLSDDTLQALAGAIDARDPYTHGHSLRVAAYSRALARAAGLGGGDLDALRRGCLLHDVGKIGVSDRVLHKRGRLDDAELDEMRRHPVTGHRLLAGLEWDDRVLDIVLHHHERWDGGGYPSGLAGPAIPPLARIVAVADALDAMLSDRPYRSAFTYMDAIDEIHRQAGSQFDPAAVAWMAAAQDEVRRVYGSQASIRPRAPRRPKKKSAAPVLAVLSTRR